ncbi:MAG: hypothetical protein RL722_1018, partial [Pseudomonadota bacterium]
LLLGGGDNAVENALHLAGLGHRVTVAARHWRGQPGLMARLQARQDIEQWRLPALPRLAPDSAARPLSLLWPGEAGAESAGPLSTPADSPEPLQRRDFDLVAVLFGFEPDPTLHGLALAALDRAHHPGLGQSPHAGALVEVAEAGLFVAGDASGRWHPCLHTALADGVRVAKAAQAWKSAGPRAEVAASSDKVSDPSPLHPPRLLRLQGLEIQASIGWLDHEHAARQAIRLDAELRLESRPLPDDDLAHVLDYRQVRELLIATCAQEGHTRLLETLVERCAQRLMRLPGVLGVRLSITKPDIFEDCHVALATELGRW